MNHQATIQAALAGILALGLAASASGGPVAQPKDSEKCYGIAKAGQNDCKAGSHDCKGQSEVDADPDSFVLLPVGTCKKIDGGSLQPQG